MLVHDSNEALLDWLDMYNPIYGLPDMERVGWSRPPASDRAEVHATLPSLLIADKEIGGLDKARLCTAKRSQFILDKAAGPRRAPPWLPERQFDAQVNCNCSFRAPPVVYGVRCFLSCSLVQMALGCCACSTRLGLELVRRSR